VPILEVVDAQTPDARPPRILVVDDDDAVRLLVRRILAPRLFELLEESSVEAAVARASRETDRVDLLLTDVVLPDGTGAELALRLHEDRPALPVLYMSGYDRATAELHGVTDDAHFLMKPFTPRTLREGVQQVLARGAT
jgi:two-component system, cell cycle sensor histidine kinase and response regulator CckA